ncbi:MAG: sel1 repeat family protein [Campylobacter sp.]|uniref:tetratricopeptide repeat protein n=1 Tax=Campylobacter sp. TaxID=205 RepID=UPI002AA7FFCB|nr:tetratricopeptide repeat protein [Campylobacter sp.]MCI6343253.1 sel1 repeat family protein [Campylobacter sp.]
MKKVVAVLVCVVVLLVGDTVLDKSGTQSSFDTKKAYEQGETFYNNKEYDKAAELYKKACDGGNMSGCFNLGIMYANGNGVEKDLGKAAELFKKACDSGNMRGCHNLGVMYTKWQWSRKRLRQSSAVI